MPHSYANVYIHGVFSTKNRQNLIAPEWQKRLWEYTEGIAGENKMSVIAAGGTTNHMHILFSLPAALPLSKALQLIKGASSKWVHDTFPSPIRFAWQEGYGAFRVSVSHVQDTIRYINAQAEHHRTVSFEEEYVAFLRKHKMDYDERYVWG